MPTYDLTVLKGSGLDTGTSVKLGYRPRTPPEQAAMSALSFNRRLSLFDDVALGAGKHKIYKDGDAWRIVIPDKDNETINFSTSTFSNSAFPERYVMATSLGAEPIQWAASIEDARAKALSTSKLVLLDFFSPT